MMCTLSIIVPIYNVEKYLDFGLKSLVVQKGFSDYEIILVNDGSTDSSVKIASIYAHKYKNIKIINKENGGVSSARNIGIKNASGKYICFFDPDDTVDETYYYNLLRLIEKQYDLGVVNYKTISKSGMKIKKKHIKRVVEGNDALRSFLSGGIIGNNLWDKIFKAEIVKQIKFNESIRVGEDMLFVFQYLRKASRIVINTDLVGYNYRINDESAMHSSFNSHFFDALKVSEEMTSIYQHDNSLNSFCMAHEAHERCKLLEYMLKNGGKGQFKKEWILNRKKLKSIDYLKTYRCLNKRQYFGIVLMNFSPTVYIAALWLLGIV